MARSSAVEPSLVPIRPGFHPQYCQTKQQTQSLQLSDPLASCRPHILEPQNQSLPTYPQPRLRGLSLDQCGAPVLLTSSLTQGRGHVCCEAWGQVLHV